MSEKVKFVSKPKDFLDLDVYPHLKINALNYDKNCKCKLTENSYYCFDCKLSVCPECGIENHKDHILIPRKPYLKYDNTFFQEIEQVISNNMKLDLMKNEMLNTLYVNIEKIEKRLQEIKVKKVNEINEIFSWLNLNFLALQKNLNEFKEKLRHYYEEHQNFFQIDNHNMDLENTIFLINFEMLNLCDNKNLMINSSINFLKEKLTDYKNNIISQSEQAIQHIDNINTPDKIREFKDKSQFDDFYWDIRQRIDVYNDNILQTRKAIFDIYKATGAFNYLADLIEIFESKNRKGVDYIFNQNLFTKYNYNLPLSNCASKDSLMQTISKFMGTDKSYGKTRGNSKRHFNNKVGGDTNSGSSYRNNSQRTLKKMRSESSKHFRVRDSSNCKGHQQDDNMDSNNNMKSLDDQTPNLNTNSANSNNNNINVNNNENDLFHDCSQIILDTPINQKYFCYSIINAYNKYFSQNKHRTNFFDLRDRLLTSYKERKILLKETAKPIIGTTDILIFDSALQKSKKVHVYLNKEKHGYTTFPAGLRHILIDKKKLYITGGINTDGKAITTTLVYDINSHVIKRLDDMPNPHCYHTIDFLENYDCFIVIGGENNKCCEIYDLYTNKWSQLPDLNFPRANPILYFHPATSEIYCIFGMEGDIKITKYSTNIEVLELNDITSGWIIVDYYKNSMVCLNQNFIDAFPFTVEKLLLQGVKEGRTNISLFVLFDMAKNEISNVNKKILDEMKLEDTKYKKCKVCGYASNK